MTDWREWEKLMIHDTPLRGEDVRQKNEKIILNAIQRHDGISQSEVVTLTGLKAPTVLRIFSYLEEQGLIQIDEHVHRDAPEKKGRKPVFYRVNPKAHYVVGVEFWSQQVSVVITDFQKNSVYQKKLDDVEIGDTQQLLAILEEIIQEGMRSAGIPPEAILGIGVGAPGRIDTERGNVIYYGRIRGMFQTPIREQLEKHFSIPVFINNNASVVAMNAYKRGVARGSLSLMTILIRSGVGGAFIDRGKLMLVQGRTALEIGHASINLDGPPCDCGAKGCLETYIAEPVLLAEVKVRLGVDTLEEFDALLAVENKAALSLAREKGALLAVEARNLYRLFSPGAFLILTRFKALSRIYAECVEETVRNDFFSRDDAGVMVFDDVYDALEAGRGAADLVFADYFGQGVGGC